VRKSYKWILGFLAFIAIVGSANAESIKIYELSGSQIAKQIESTEGQRRIIMIYTSWCPYCRKAMPQMMEMERENPGSVIALSDDESFDAFAKYAKTLDDAPFHFLMVKEGETRSKLGRALSKFGIKGWNGYPTYIMLDENNKVFAQGNYDHDKLEDFLAGKLVSN
jgi:thiol-disulfide isomerase/thioredoxin